MSINNFKFIHVIISFAAISQERIVYLIVSVFPRPIVHRIQCLSSWKSKSWIKQFYLIQNYRNKINFAISSNFFRFTDISGNCFTKCTSQSLRSLPCCKSFFLILALQCKSSFTQLYTCVYSTKFPNSIFPRTKLQMKKMTRFRARRVKKFLSPVHPRLFRTRTANELIVLQKLSDRKPLAIKRFKMEGTDA